MTKTDAQGDEAWPWLCEAVPTLVVEVPMAAVVEGLELQPGAYQLLANRTGVQVFDSSQVSGASGYVLSFAPSTSNPFWFDSGNVSLVGGTSATPTQVGFYRSYHYPFEELTSDRRTPPLTIYSHLAGPQLDRGGR